MSYFLEALDYRRSATIKAAIDILTPKADLFDAIAFTGMSGAVVAPILAYHLDKHLLAIRKEPCHSNSIVEHGSCPPDSRILIVDDFISSGKTVNTMIAKLKVWSPTCIVMAAYLYKESAANTKFVSTRVDVPIWSRKK